MDNPEPYRSTNVKFDDFELDLSRRRIYRGGDPVPLFAKAFDILEVLVSRNGEVVTKRELMDAVWPDQYVEEANLTVQVSAIRKALGEDRHSPKYLITIPGKGYRFAGQTEPPAAEIVVERSSTLVLSTETEVVSTNNRPLTSAGSVERSLGATIVTSRFGRKAAFAVILTSVLVLAIGAFFYRLPTAAPVNGGFKAKRFTRITNTGDVTAVAVSPDGNYVAFVRGTAAGNSLSLQQIGSGLVVEVVPASPGQFWGLTFSPDGKFVYYNLFLKGQSELALYRVRALGGKPEALANNVTGAVSFSPDGNSIAYIQPDAKRGVNHLMVADALGKNSRIVLSKPHPETFIFEGRSTSWSPDGRNIACIVNRFESGANYTSVVSINVDDGIETPLGSVRWHEISRVEWTKNGSAILVAGKRERTDTDQIWYMQSPFADAVRVTNDLNSYSSVGAANSGNMLVAIQSYSEHKLSVGFLEPRLDSLTELVSETNELQPIEWVADERIVFRSDKDGTTNLWSIKPDGTDRRQLTVDAGVDFRGFCITPDQKYIVFSSWRNGQANIWRVRYDRTEYTQLTDGPADAFPQCLADGRQIVFQRGIYSKPEICKVPVLGGEAERINVPRGKWPSLLSNDQGISYFRMSDDKWMIDITNPAKEKASTSFQVPQSLEGNRVRWSEDNSKMFFIGAEGTAGNIWVRDIITGGLTQVTDLKRQRISDFAFSPDRKRVAVISSVVTSDVIMVESDGR